MNKLYSELYLTFIFFSISLIFLFINTPLVIANATTSNDNEDDNEGTNEKETLKLKIKINLNNLDPNVQKIKLVSFVNGEVKEQYIHLLKEKSKAKNNIITIESQFNKSNDVSSIVATDQYFVCGYVVNDKIMNQKDISNIAISLYDCDEGNIGSADSSTAHLFYTLNKFNDSINYNKINGNGDPLAKEVKINVKVPLEDAINDVDLISVVGMVRGEYKVETLDAKEALEKQGDNNDNILDIPFVFNRLTEVGPIQLGDKFFGCVAAEELSPQHTHCEKRMIKDFEKGNELYSRKDNNFK